MMKKCTNCGAALLKDASFCSECGNEIQKDAHSGCPECGAQINAEDLFCTNCGTTLASSAIHKSTPPQEKPKSLKGQKPKSRSTTTRKLKEKSGSDKGSGGNWFKIAVVAAAVFILYQLIPWSSFNDDSDWTGGGYTEETSKANDLSNVYDDPALEQARQDYLEAYDRYTKLATQGGEGNSEAALADYRSKYEKYKRLLEGKRSGDQSNSSYASSENFENNTITQNTYVIPVKKLPTVTLSTPDGASIEIPGRTSIFTDSLAWTTRQSTAEEISLGFGKNIYEFRNFDPKKIVGKSTIKIPIAQDVRSIWFKGTMGFWIPLNFAIKESIGNLKAELTMDEEPTPWEFAISIEQFEPAIFSSVHRDLFAFEQAMAQNRKLVQKNIPNIEARLFSKIERMSMFGSFTSSDPAVEWTERLIYLWKLFRTVDLEGTTAESWKRYRLGIEELYTLRRLPQKERDQYDLSNYLFEFKYKKDGQKIREVRSLPEIWSCTNTTEWIEYWGSKYAPWGIELTRELVRLFEKSGQQQGMFLSCLNPVGGANDWVDLMLPDEDVPAMVRDSFFNKYERDFDPVVREKQTVLRVYAPRALEMSYIHMIVYGTDQFLRYFPVVYGIGVLAAVISGGLLAPAATPLAYSLFINISWAMIEWTTEDIVKGSLEDAEMYENVNYAHTGYQNVYKEFLLATGKKAGVKLNKQVLRKTLSDGKWNKRELLVSLLCAAALDALGDGEMDRLIKINNTRPTYYNRYLPPVVINTVYNGRSRTKDGEYGADLIYKGVFHLNTNRIYAPTWYKNFNTESEIYGGGTTIFTKDSRVWTRYSTDKLIHSHRPQRQFIRVNLSKELIDWRKMRYESYRLEKLDWKTIDLNELDLWIHLRPSTNDFYKMLPLHDVTQPEDIAMGRRSAIIEINLGLMQIGSSPQYPKGFYIDGMFYDPVLGPAYQLDKDKPQSIYTVDVGYRDKNNIYQAVSESVKLDFSNANEKAISFQEKDRLLPLLEENIPATFIAIHKSTFGSPLPAYRWHVVNTKPLKPKEKVVVITGQVYQKGVTAFEDRKGVPGVTLSCTFAGKDHTVVTDSEGRYRIVLSCTKGIAKIVTNNVEQKVEITRCPQQEELNFELEEKKQEESQTAICTYLAPDTRKIMENDGWGGSTVWERGPREKTGYLGGRATNDKGEWFDLEFEEMITAQAYIDYDGKTLELPKEGIKMDQFQPWLMQINNNQEGKSINRGSFHRTTFNGHQAIKYEVEMSIPSYIKKDTVINYIGGDIARIDQRWTGGNTEKMIIMGVEGSPGAKLAIIVVVVNAETSHPSALGENKEKKIFQETLNDVTSTLEKITFEVKPCQN